MPAGITSANTTSVAPNYSVQVQEGTEDQRQPFVSNASKQPVARTPPPFNFFMPVLFERHFHSYNGWKKFLSLLLIAGLYGGAEFVCAFLTVFMANLQGFMWSSTTLTAPSVSTTVVAPTGGIVISSWLTSDISLISSIATSMALLTLTFAITVPGVTGSPIQAFFQLILEGQCETADAKKTGRSACGAVTVFFLKWLIVLAAQFSGAVAGGKAAASMVPNEVVDEFARRITLLGDRQFSSEHAWLAVANGGFFALYILVFELYFRITPIGNRPPMYNHFSYTGGCIAVALVKFIGVFCMFGMSGSTLNFITFQVHGMKDRAWWLQFGSESIGGGLAFFLCVCVVGTSNLFTRSSYMDDMRSA